MKKIIFTCAATFLLFLPLNTGCAIDAGFSVQKVVKSSGSAIGRGETSGDAYMDAVSKVLPRMEE